jgi:hypothetical protein
LQIANCELLIATPLLKKFLLLLKQEVEKSYLSPTMGVAETHVSVHSSHHTPPGLYVRAVPYV